MADIKGPKKFKFSLHTTGHKRKDYNYLMLLDVYNLTFEEAKEITQEALSGNKWARNLFKKARQLH